MQQSQTVSDKNVGISETLLLYAVKQGNWSLSIELRWEGFVLLHNVQGSNSLLTLFYLIHLTTPKYIVADGVLGEWIREPVAKLCCEKRSGRAKIGLILFRFFAMTATIARLAGSLLGQRNESSRTTSSPGSFRYQSLLFKTCGQSYKASTIVIYASRVVPDLKIPHITTLES